MVPLLHRHRRVTAQHAQDRDFAGALVPPRDPSLEPVDRSFHNRPVTATLSLRQKRDELLRHALVKLLTNAIHMGTENSRRQLGTRRKLYVQSTAFPEAREALDDDVLIGERTVTGPLCVELPGYGSQAGAPLSRHPPRRPPRLHVEIDRVSTSMPRWRRRAGLAHLAAADTDESSSRQGLGRPSTEHLVSQIDDATNVASLANPAPTR